MTFQQWATQVCNSLNYYGSMKIVEKEANWREFARRLIRDGAVGENLIPHENLFDDWRAWARSFQMTAGSALNG